MSTHVRETSIEAYKKICEDGSLSNMKRLVYDLLYRHGPATTNELMAKFKEENPKAKHQTIESVGRRVSDLVRDGVAEEVGKIKCPITNMMVIVRDVNSSLPKKKDSIDELNKQISSLEAKIAQLKYERAQIGAGG